MSGAGGSAILSRYFELSVREELEARFASATRALQAALNRAAKRLELIPNGPQVRSGVDGQYFISVTRGWLEVHVIVKTRDYQPCRDRIEAAIDEALAGASK